jgi:poly(3-hydroxybutyrate) depolymerase
VAFAERGDAVMRSTIIHSDHSRFLSYLLAAALVVAGPVAVGFAGTANAAVNRINSSAVPDPPVFDGSCGFQTMKASTRTEKFTEEAGRGRTEGITLYTYEYSFRDVYTDPDTGEVLFVARGKGKVKDTKAKPLGGGLFQITTKDTGQHMIVEDGNGRVRGHDSGSHTFNYVIDQNGNFVQFLSERIPGPKPQSMCKMVGSFLGTGSSARLTAHPLGSEPTSPLGYYEYLPPGYGSGEKKPLLLFFHGFGQSGDGSADQLPNLLTDSNIPAYINSDNWPADRPFVVLAPQHNPVQDVAYPYEDCDGENFIGSCWMTKQHGYGNPASGSQCMRPQEVVAFLEFALANYDVDPSRVYVTGLSCGAYGIWEALPQLGGRVAAAVPIAGYGLPIWKSAGCAVGSVPIWAFHGEADDIVDPEGSSLTIANLRNECPAPPAADDLKLTTYEGVDHNAWDRAYSGYGGNDIYSWMLRHTSG